MSVSHWICGKTKRYMIRNDKIRERVGLAFTIEKMVETRLEWFGHVERRPLDYLVKRVDQMEGGQNQITRRRRKTFLRQTIRKDP